MQTGASVVCVVCLCEGKTCYDYCKKTYQQSQTQKRRCEFFIKSHNKRDEKCENKRIGVNQMRD